MTVRELMRIRLYRQHLTNKSDRHTVLHDLNGLQAQFMSNAEHSLRIRCSEPLSHEDFGDGLVKNWTVRGTVHIFNRDDLPVFKYGRDIHRSEDFKGYGIFRKDTYNWYADNESYKSVLEKYSKDGYAWTLSPDEQREWSRFIVQKVSEGVFGREELKAECRSAGMTIPQLESMFNQWGGGMRELCERGFLNYRVKEKKEFELCPDFEPMEKDEAEREILHRYFLHYAPATIRDAAYYMGCTQARVKELTQDMNLKKTDCEGREMFYLSEIEKEYPEIPAVLFLGGFDQLMLGYKKEESIFLPQEHLRKIFNLAGIVMPPILVDGRVAGRWRRKNRNVNLEMFADITDSQKKVLLHEAEIVFGNANILISEI